MTDVLVVGAGPAGAIAALVLARAGVRVTLLDRATFPRDKLCGDTVNPGALAVLRRLHLEGAAEGGRPVDGMVVTGERGVRVVGPYGAGQQGIALSRRVLDERLVAAAVAAGATLHEGVLVQGPLRGRDGTVTGIEAIRSSGGRERHSATVTIAADGRASRIAHTMGLARTPLRPRRWAVGAVFSGVTGITTYGEMHVRAGRYLGVAPLPGGYTNSCIVTADRAALKTRDLLMTALRSDAVTADRFASARIVAGPSVLGPLALDVRVAGASGLLLAGDAAGFIDPMTGDGLRFAFRGGELAAEEALRVLAEGWRDAHVRLDRDRRREFAAKWRFNRALRALVASPRAVEAAGVGARLTPAVLQRVVRYAGDVALA